MAIFKYLPNSIPISINETLRYMGVRGGATPAERALAKNAVEKAYSVLHPQVCYAICEVSHGDNFINFGFGEIYSYSLKKLLENCERAIIFAATSGTGADRLILAGKALGITAALAADAAATAFTEALCDSFCEHIRNSLNEGERLTMRFSPGYGDVPLSLQKDIFNLLECPKNIGLTLTDSLLMVPSKSVTAIMGISKSVSDKKCCKSCKSCNMKACVYRKEENV